MEEKVGITLDQKQVLELKEIIIDKDKEAAFKFLDEYIYKPIKRSEEGHCKPQF
ncbi:MAG: hypothetical protein JSV30_02970 [Candidatus Omnitrophota bacterium]|nr:MAG: hypothetical protein JSV30_02970 [Candidatus Omnitrophota bacterium]